jgi:hypothetical protein
MRYSDVPIIKDTTTGKRYYKAVKYPTIPYTNEDVYIIITFGDRLDLIANDYYGSVNDYWILMAANDIPRDSIFPPPGTQLRIPSDVVDARIRFNSINEI